MQGQAQEKVKGGKLVRVTVDYTDVLQKVMITGDFFLHPEESLEYIEQALAGLSIDNSKEEIEKTISTVVKENNIMLVGITSDAIARLIKQAVSND